VTLDTVEDVIEALKANDREPYGRSRTVTAEQLVEAADRLEDPEVQVVALLDLMEAYEFDGELRKTPVVFARVLKLWDTRREAFSPWAEQQVYWRFKWVSSALLEVPDVPLAAVERWHEEMRERYLAAGHDLQPYYRRRYALAAHTGTGAADAFDLWATRRRTPLSDCEACETHTRALYHVERGDDARALEEWEPVLTGRQTCAEEPWNSQASALLPLLRRGRLDEARSAHLTGYRRARGKAALATAIGRHIEFCALSGNAARGVEILAENRELLDTLGDPDSRLHLLTGVEVLLGVLVADGHADLPVSGPGGRSWTAGELAARLRSEADGIAARFDARNGTSAVGDRRRARLAAKPLLAEPLPLGVHAAAVVPAPRAAQEPEVIATPAAAPGTAAPDAEVPADFTALVLLARERADVSHPEASRLWKRIAALLDASEPDASQLDAAEVGGVTRLRAEIAEQAAYDTAEEEDEDDAPASAAAVDPDSPDARRARLLAEAAELFEAAGLPGRALAMRARRYATELGDADAPGAPAADWSLLDELRDEASRLESEGRIEDADVLAVLQVRAFAAWRAFGRSVMELTEDAAPRDSEAAALARSQSELLRREAAARGRRHTAVGALQYLSDTAARTGDLAEAERLLAEGLALLDEIGMPWRAPRVLGQRAQVLMALDRAKEAVPLLQESLSLAARYSPRGFPFARTWSMLGHAAEHAGDTATAVHAFSQAAERFERSPRRAGAAPEDTPAARAAGVRLQLAEVLREAGRVADAVAVVESVLADPASEELPERLRGQLRLTLGRLLGVLGEHRDAAEEYVRLAEEVSGWDPAEDDTPDIRTMVACETAAALARAGAGEAAEAALRRAMEAHAASPRADQVLETIRVVARESVGRRGAEAVEGALALLAEADALREAAVAAGQPCTGWYQEGSVHYERARCLTSAERWPEALAAVEAAIAAYEPGGENAERPRAEAVRIAALIEVDGLGRPNAALARLAPAAARAEAAGHPDAAGVLRNLAARIAEQSGPAQ